MDIDGVLVTEQSMVEFQSPFKFDPRCVEWLNLLISKTNAMIVVSSTWRIGKAISELQLILMGQGVSCFVLDKTPLIDDAPRGVEIKQWLEEFGEPVEFVILDDDSDMADLKHRLIQTTFEHGLEENHVEQAIRLFG